MISVLTKLNPLEVLKNGYAFVEKNDKKVSSVASLDVGDEIKISFYDGEIKANKDCSRLFLGYGHLKKIFISKEFLLFSSLLR